MRTPQRYLARIILAMAALSLPVCCTKSLNPKVERFPSADFDITVTEKRQSATFEYHYDRITGDLSIDPAVQQLQELWITQWNEVSLSLEGLDPAFRGANVSSSDPEVVRVIRNGGASYSLEYVSDGTAVITAWNSDEYEYSFTVHSRQAIELEYITMEVDDLLGHREVKMPLRPYHPIYTYKSFDANGYTEDTCHIRVCSEYIKFRNGYKPVRVQKYRGGFPGRSKFCDPLSDGATFKIGRLHPENASWRTVDIESSECGNAVVSWRNEICKGLGWPEYMKSRVDFKSMLEESGLDWSEVQGRRALVLWGDEARRDGNGELQEWVPYVFAAKVYTEYGRKQPNMKGAKLMFAYCLPFATEQCDFPPTAENPVNQVWQGYESCDWFDDQYWEYEY